MSYSLRGQAVRGSEVSPEARSLGAFEFFLSQFPVLGLPVLIKAPVCMLNYGFPLILNERPEGHLLSLHPTLPSSLFH